MEAEHKELLIEARKHLSAYRKSRMNCAMASSHPAIISAANAVSDSLERCIVKIDAATGRVRKGSRKP